MCVTYSLYSRKRGTSLSFSSTARLACKTFEPLRRETPDLQTFACTFFNSATGVGLSSSTITRQFKVKDYLNDCWSSIH